MTEVNIDRLILQVPDLSAMSGKRLALQIAEGLGTLTGGLDVPGLRLDLRAPAGANVDELAQQILAELLLQVRRLP
jgi:hypothetical protein